MSDRKGTRYSTKGDKTCDVTIPEFRKKSNTTSWESLNKKIKKDPKLFAKFSKVMVAIVYDVHVLCSYLGYQTGHIIYGISESSYKAC